MKNNGLPLKGVGSCERIESDIVAERDKSFEGELNFCSGALRELPPFRAQVRLSGSAILVEFRYGFASQ
jgi:hypothetical protein